MTYFSKSLTFLQNKRFWPYAYSMNNSTLCPVSLTRFKTHCACPGIPMICSWVRHCTLASPAWIAPNTARTVTELRATVCVAFTGYCDHCVINLSKASQWWFATKRQVGPLADSHLWWWEFGRLMKSCFEVSITFPTSYSLILLHLSPTWIPRKDQAFLILSTLLRWWLAHLHCTISLPLRVRIYSSQTQGISGSKTWQYSLTNRSLELTN